MRHARKDYERIQDPEGKIPEEEPVFLIRGQDVSAPAALRYWAAEHRANGGADELACLAELQAAEMEKWQRSHVQKVADR